MSAHLFCLIEGAGVLDDSADHQRNLRQNRLSPGGDAFIAKLRTADGSPLYSVAGASTVSS